MGGKWTGRGMSWIRGCIMGIDEREDLGKDGMMKWEILRDG
jgi:hypothetical protein